MFWSAPLAPLLGELSSAGETEGGLAPPSGELSSASKTERAEGVPMGKRMVGVGAVFSLLHRKLPRRPLSPVCALGTSPKMGSALRGEGVVLKTARRLN